MRATASLAHNKVGAFRQRFESALLCAGSQQSLLRQLPGGHMSARRNFSAMIFSAVLVGLPALAQDSLLPAEQPPASFEGREYVDSRGCVFLRSTFGGQVTWVPRFGPDRQPICNGQATVTEAEAPAAADTPADAAATTAEAPAPAVRPVTQPIGQVRLPAATSTAKEPPRRVARATAPRKPARHAGIRGPNADGRHPDCPANAQFGRLVRMETGKIMVMCVVSPDHFPEGAHVAHAAPHVDTHVSHAPKSHAVAPMAAHGSVLQVGSFGVAANAARVMSRLQAHGIPVNTHRSGHLTIVSAGPFTDQGHARHAMGVVRSLGIRDAFYR